MPTVGLLHGCTQGPSCWDPVVPLLHEGGVRTVVADLDPEALADGGARECAEVVAAALEGEDDVVLVGTSCTGLVVPVVTALRPLRALVYVCAALPAVGRSLDQQLEDEGVVDEEWMAFAGDPCGEDALRRFMLNDCSQEAQDAARGTVRLLLPARLHSEVFPLDAMPDVPAHYVLGTQDRIIRPDWSRRAARERLGVEPVELPTGHCPQTSRPDLLAQVLLGVAEDVAA